MFDASIEYFAAQYGISENWIRAVIQVESNWNPNAYNPNDPGGGAYGLGQILLSTARGLGYTGSADGLFDPATNIHYIAQLLAQLRDAYGDDFRRVYSAYNSGNPDLWQTSAQVAANVARAVDALAQYIEENPGTAAAIGGAGILIIGALLFFFLRRH